MHKRSQHAFSLAEQMLTLALISIACGIALPSLSAAVQKNQSEALRDRLQASLHAARTYAVLHRRPVEICASQNGKQCSSNWDEGWMTRLSKSPNNLIERHQILQPTQLDWQGFGANIRFLANGTSPASNGRFYQCQAGAVFWQLIINRQGRVRAGSRAENQALSSKCP
ncbi:GspH/FimT family pseudopilin [Pseudomonas sp. Gutcm_11s]|uniref:GspH/FimT family pseudopilin n=1 Tax=Pseudomonas sp. Gutcm_11s TaxID=3026088 RepID=UPI002361AC9D|nr:GspH/FimT family pseudopilin [Pseudomonas sp. Gutcm_11s]MDD0844525.1 GspH/FimT family pseudopilin [Pseudomonas sp. Gutcm_11s]